jgi:hypothetical protein
MVKIVGCDIGGVVKSMISDEPIENAIESIKELENRDFKIVFISKCNDNYRNIITEWLNDKKLNNDVYFCKDYSDKRNICISLKVDYMIDDKLCVFKECLIQLLNYGYQTI